MEDFVEVKVGDEFTDRDGAVWTVTEIKVTIDTRTFTPTEDTLIAGIWSDSGEETSTRGRHLVYELEDGDLCRKERKGS